MPCLLGFSPSTQVRSVTLGEVFQVLYTTMETMARTQPEDNDHAGDNSYYSLAPVGVYEGQPLNAAGQLTLYLRN